MHEIAIRPPPTAVAATLAPRKTKSKVKSGCRTCKVRKVKCDEGRPACHRCVSTGRACDGYGIWGGGSSNYSSSYSSNSNSNYSNHRQTPADAKTRDRRVALCPATPVSRPLQPTLVLRLGAQEKIYFDWFRCKTASKLPGTFSSSFWSTLLFQAGTNEPAVLHAMLALGSADKKGAVGMGIHKNPKRTINEQEQFTLQHYVKAISHLQPHFSAKDRTSCRVALIACIVFVCLEFLRGHYKTAQLHLQNGIEILGHMQGLSDAKSGVLALKHSPDWADDRIVEAISRLHLQVELFRHLYQHSCLIIKPALDPQKPPITQFHSLNDAWKYLDPIFNKIFYLTHQARQQLISATEQTLQNELKARLSHWLQLFETFCREQPCEGDDGLEKLYQILRINHTMVSIMADTCLRSDENVYDLYTDQFILLIAQLSKLWIVSARTEDLEVEMSLHLTYMPRAIMDVGWIPPLYFTAVKCRVHRLRVQAIRLLRTSPHREGIWDASIAACVASKVVEMEEGDFYQGFDLEDDFPLETLPNKQDLSLPLLPESHRLSEAEVELSGAPMDRISLFCKREEDGINRKVLLSQYSVPLQCWIDT